MAFQGKGIFGGFSGKVGNIMGYTRNGKHIIQSIGKRLGDVNRFGFNLVLYIPVNLLDCAVSLGEADRIGTGTSLSNGFRSPFGFNGGSVVYNWQIETDGHRNWAYFQGAVGNDSPTSSLISVRLFTSDIRVYDNGSLVANLPVAVAGENFQFRIDNGVATFWRDNATGTMIKVYDFATPIIGELYYANKLVYAIDKAINLSSSGTNLVAL